MADMFVHILVENLKELMRSEHPIIGSQRNQATLRFLHDNVSVMSNFLKRTEVEKCSADEEVKLLLTEIRDVTYEVENYVDSFVREAIVADREFRPRSDPNWSSWKMLRKLIEAVRIEVDHMNAKLDLSKLTRYRSADDGQKRVNSETMVGMEETMDKLLSRLTDGNKSMEVISVVGSPGIGKSTVAQRLFDHGRIKSSFPIRAWSTVSQTYDCKRLLIDILQSSSLFEGDDGNYFVDKLGEELLKPSSLPEAGSNGDYSVDELGEELLKRLKGKRYLIVLDDIWGIEAWNDIQRSLPDQHNRSRVLFTSRFAAIGKDVSDDINTHYMSGLSEEHSWNLLKKKVFGHGQCPPELVGSGMEMVRKCDGLPLAIVVTGGLLAKKDKNPEFWEQVASNLAPAIATNPETSFMNTIELSYQHLPIHLKACFLYLGSFPLLRYKLSLRSFIWLLIAEGFVIQGTEEKSLEVIAEGYINELVEWSLVIIDGKKSCGAMKAVRIHDLLRVFCAARGNQEKFNTTPYEYFGELLCCGANCTLLMWESILIEQCRLDCYHYRPSNIRSFCSEALPYRNYRDFEYFFQGFGNLVHLRYFSSALTYLWSEWSLEFAKLLALETLFLEPSMEYVTLDLPNDVWNMVKLRHLYHKRRGVFHFQTSPPQGAVLGNLQTLYSLCACDSCLAMLVRTPNIRKLGLSNIEFLKINMFLKTTCLTVLNLCFLKQLETLKVFGPFSSGKAGIIPNPEFPASLRKLTLEYTYLRWENISFLEQLPNLEVLKLLDYAFSVTKVAMNDYWDMEDVNAYWDTSEVDFPKLKYLEMGWLDIVKWEDQDLKFESLEVLVLEGCLQLETIPFGLAGCPSLHTINVRRCNTSVCELARAIVVEHENMYGNSDLQVFITDPFMSDESDDSDEHDESDDSDEHDESDNSDEHDESDDSDENDESDDFDEDDESDD